MSASLAFLRFVAKAALNHVGFGIGGDFAVEVLPEITRSVWRWWGDGKPEGQLREELQKVAQLPDKDWQRVAEQAVLEEATSQSQTDRQQVTAFVSLIPSAIRQSQRSPSDPTGRTMSSALSLVRPDDLLPLLPARPPRFKPGDRPLPGVDLVLVELLGTGGFGEVWKARNPLFSGVRPVALKFCLDPASKDQLLQHEAAVLDQVMMQGRHPGIVPLLHTYLSANPPFLEYEFVEGGELSGIIRDAQPNGGLPPSETTYIVQEVAEIVGFAHRLNPPIVHRDLKPANILVQNSPNGKRVFRVADFGIGGAAAMSALNAPNLGTSARGDLLATKLRGSYTPLYASPQQIRSEPPDVRDDVHALGVIWYQLLTGSLSSGAPTGLWTEDLEAAGMSRELIRLLGACVDTQADKRPADATVLCEQLERLLTQPTSKPTGVHTRKAAAAVIAQLDNTPRTEQQLIELARQNCPDALAGTDYVKKDRCRCPKLRRLACEGRVRVEVRDGVEYYSLLEAPPGGAGGPAAPTTLPRRNKGASKKPDWSRVTKKHIQDACEMFDSGAAQPKRPAQSTFLLLNGKTYPAKFIRGLAYWLATDIELDPSHDYQGGMETVRFFDRLDLQTRHDVDKGGRDKKGQDS